MASENPRPPDRRPEPSALLADCLARGSRLARTPNRARDLRWHVAAFYLGDLNAIVSARLRKV